MEQKAFDKSYTKSFGPNVTKPKFRGPQTCGRSTVDHENSDQAIFQIHFQKFGGPTLPEILELPALPNIFKPRPKQNLGPIRADRPRTPGPKNNFP